MLCRLRSKGKRKCLLIHIFSPIHAQVFPLPFHNLLVPQLAVPGTETHMSMQRKSMVFCSAALPALYSV